LKVLMARKKRNTEEPRRRRLVQEVANVVTGWKMVLYALNQQCAHRRVGIQRVSQQAVLAL
jgi:hypothetical protein